MKRLPVILGLVLLLLTGSAALPGPGNPLRDAQATHGGDIICPASEAPVHDAVVAPGEYLESYFDPGVKTLVYFGCTDDARRTMHVALIAPTDGWTEFRLQAHDDWNGDLNAVRVSLSDAEELQVLDAFIDGETGAFYDDATFSGTQDVFDAVGAHEGDFHIYEFAVPLFSSDFYDSRLVANGSFRFQLVHNFGESAVVASGFQFLQVGPPTSPGRWTEVEMSLPAGNEPREAAQVILSLRDEHGRPLAGFSLSVFVETAFGFLDLGPAITSDQGVASVEYAPRDEGVFLIGAAFAGEHGYLASVSWARLTLPAIAPGPNLLPTPYLGILALIVIVLGTVWGTYAYVLFIMGRSLHGRLPIWDALGRWGKRLLRREG